MHSQPNLEPAENVPTLRQQIRELGLNEMADLIVSWARPGWHLVEDPHGSAGFFGPPSHAPDIFEWPRFGGSELKGLACLSLEALPSVAAETSLPRDGHLLFFADMSNNEPLLDLQDSKHNQGAASVIHTATTPAPGPGGSRINASQFLTLPHWDIAEERGLPEHLLEAYQLLWSCQDGTGATPPWQSLARSGGYPYWVQGPYEPELLLLQIKTQVETIGSDRHLYFVADPDDVMNSYHVLVQW